MTTKKYYTKKQVEQMFKEIYADALSHKWKTDKPEKRMFWNDYIDSLIKDGEIRPNTDWDQPKFIKS